MKDVEYPTARPFLPQERSVERLAEAADGCQGCPLYQNAARVVFGEGPSDAAIMVVGEVPGEREDRTGRPFVGAAGDVLDDALQQGGLKRGDIYLTNAVKHCKSTVDGAKVEGVRPDVAEIEACYPWLEAEIASVRPELVIALGTVAARSLLGRPVLIRDCLGEWFQTREGIALMVSYHPGAVLKAPHQRHRRRILERLGRDFAQARDFVFGEQRPGV